MKFVLFNVVVAAALVFLFLRDRQNTVDMHSLAEAAGEAAQVGERLAKGLTGSRGGAASVPATGASTKDAATADKVASEKVAGEKAQDVAPKTEREVARPSATLEPTPSLSTPPLPPAVEVAVRTAHPVIEGGPDVARSRCRPPPRPGAGRGAGGGRRQGRGQRAGRDALHAPGGAGPDDAHREAARARRSGGEDGAPVPERGREVGP